MVSEIEFDLPEAVDSGRKCLVDFSAGKNQLVLFDQHTNTGVIDVRIDGPVLEESASFKMLELNFSSKLDSDP